MRRVSGVRFRCAMGSLTRSVLTLSTLKEYEYAPSLDVKAVAGDLYDEVGTIALAAASSFRSRWKAPPGHPPCPRSHGQQR